MTSVPLPHPETRCWPPCGRCWGAPQSGVRQPRGPICGDEGKSRIKAGVTSDTRQVTSARSADRFKDFRAFPAGPLFGVSFGLQIEYWCLISLKPSRSKELGRRL